MILAGKGTGGQENRGIIIEKLCSQTNKLEREIIYSIDPKPTKHVTHIFVIYCKKMSPKHMRHIRNNLQELTMMATEKPQLSFTARATVFVGHC